MRSIKYILIDETPVQNPSDTRGRRPQPLFGYHFCVNSEGLAVPLVDIHQPVSLIEGPIYDPDKFNRCSITIRYCGSLRLESWLMEPGTNCKTMLQQRQALLELLVELRKHFPDAKILGLSELKPKESHARNIIVSDTMNQLRRELSDLP